METKNYEKRRCLFCGRERMVAIVEKDGCDYMGHHRGQSESWVEDDGCDCALGKLVGKAEIKPMCRNCKSFKFGYCTNKKKIDSLSTMFAVGDRVLVKQPENKCEEYKLDMDIFKDLLSTELHIE